MLRNQARKRLIKCCPNEMADSRVEHSFPTAASCLRLKASSETSIPPPYLVRASKAMFGAINKGSAFIEALPDLFIMIIITRLVFFQKIDTGITTR